MNDPHAEAWDLYDQDGNPLRRRASRGDSLEPGEYHRVVQVWVRNRNGEYLIQKRTEHVAFHPGIWATTAGSVVAGEDSRSAAIRELAEELGIHADPSELEQVLQRLRGDSIGIAWLLERDVAANEIRLQPDEVADVKWATPAEIRRMVENQAFYDYESDYFDTVFSHPSRHGNSPPGHSIQRAAALPPEHPSTGARNATISNAIEFLIELEKLKRVERRSYPIGMSRRENSAEHSWSLAVGALTLAPMVDPELNLARILEMVIVHDIVEIDAGDTFCYADQTGKQEKEERAARRIFGILPEPQAERFLGIWHEFEAKATREALFAHALDRIFPLLQNYHSRGCTWRENGVSYDQVLERNKAIRDGSDDLWQYALEIIQSAVKQGWLPTRTDLQKDGADDGCSPGP